MYNFSNVFFLLLLFVSQLVASESEEPSDNIKLVVQPSKYVSFNSSNIIGSKELISFEGKLLVLGKGIYGHFDSVAFDDSGKVVEQIKTIDSAYKRDQGTKIKTISLSIDADTSCARVEVLFHEMRINPDLGACKP